MPQKLSFKNFLILKSKILFCGLCVLLVLLSSAKQHSFAQSSSLPGFSVPKDNTPVIPLGEGSDAFSNYQTAFLRYENKALADTLLLQYQISILRMIIKRQDEMGRIIQSYKQLGVPFKQPKPAKTTCERIPENLLCILSYPSLFGIEVPETGQSQQVALPGGNAASGGMDFLMAAGANNNDPFADFPGANMTSVNESDFLNRGSGRSSSGNRRDDSSNKRGGSSKREEPVTSPYLWSDIQCAGRVCRAVLINSERAGVRRTVRLGDLLPDNSVVENISVEGVSLNLLGQTLTIDPAPANEGLINDDANNNDFGTISDILGNSAIADDLPGSNSGNAQAGTSAGGATNNAAPTGNASTSGEDDPFANDPLFQNDEAFESDTAEPTSDEPAMLGPTGLF
jgi:hypothetical protein